MSCKDPRIAAAEQLLEVCLNFPKSGVTFRNLFPILRNPQVFKGLLDAIAEDIREKYPGVEVIVGLESRGFLLGPILALALNAAFVPVRKKGKLPGETIQIEYSLEYGKDICEIQTNSIRPGQKVVIVDDLLATGGTMKAACDLINAANAEILACVVVMELIDLQGKAKLTHPLLSYMMF